MSLATPSAGLEELVNETSGREIVATSLLVDKYADLKKKYDYFFDDNNDMEKWSKEYVQEILLPCDINTFLQTTRYCEEHTDYSFTGFFISQLIKNSYNAGNNDFKIDVNDLRLVDFLAYEISGTEEQKVRVAIKGRAWDWCGQYAQNCTFIIEKAGDECGQSAQYSTFTIGEAENWCGKYAKNSTFIIEKAGHECGSKAQHSTFTIEKAGNWCGQDAQYSTFKTNNQQQYERFKKSVNQNKGNKVYLLSDTGSIIKGGSW